VFTVASNKMFWLDWDSIL